MAFEEYHDIWEMKDNNYRRLDLSKSAVIFMDCKDVTGDHVHYHLMNEHPVYKTMVDCAYRIAEDANLDCTIYGGIDEVSVIFSDPQQLYDYFRVDDCADYILTLYMQRFLKLFWEYYPDIYIKNTLFSIPAEHTERFLAYRKEICHSGALFYQAKEHLDKNLYRGPDFTIEQMEELLKNHGLYDEVITNDLFYNGIKKVYKGKSALQRISDMFSIM